MYITGTNGQTSHDMHDIGLSEKLLILVAPVWFIAVSAAVVKVGMQRCWSPWRARGARAYNGGLGA